MTCDGDISDIRGFNQPGAPPPIEQPDPDGFSDEPILRSQAGGYLSPSGYNIGSIVVAYDPVDHAYYVGFDVSTPAIMDEAFGTASAAWDGDGDSFPNSISDGWLMTPQIQWDIPGPFDVPDIYRLGIDIGQTGGALDIIVNFEWQSVAPTASVGAVTPGTISVTAEPVDPGPADFGGDGPDIEFCITGLDVAFPNKDPCDFYRVTVGGFADTAADSAEEQVVAGFEFDQPFTICKVDETGAGVPGWTFTVNGESVTTDDNGCVTVFMPPDSGPWQICESLPDGQRICGVTVDGNPVTPTEGPTGTWCITVDADCHEVIWCNEVCLADIRACKIDCRTGEPLAGWDITLTHPDGTTETKVTDDSGCVTFTDLPVGNYTVTETVLPGWEMCPGETGVRTVTLTCANHGQTVVLDPFKNQPCLGTITACKLDCDGNLIVEPSFLISLLDADGNVIASGHTQNGCVTFTDLSVGTYTVCETMLAGWELCPGYDDCYTVEISCDQKEVSVEFRNQPCLGTIKACKYDCDGTPLAGWKITLDTAAGDPVASAITDDSGCVTFTDVAVGEYVVCETMLAGWELCPGYELCYPVTISCEQKEAYVEFRNQPCLGTITACKYDCDDLPVAAWEIVLTGETVIGPISRVMMTGPDGCVTFTELPAGIYEVCEDLPPGWELCDPEMWPRCQTVEISCDVRQAYVEFRNYPTVGPTRTPGYWFTHPDAMEIALAEDCGYYIAGGEFLLDCCMFDIYDANRVFWLGNRELEPNVRRTLGMHIMAAMCNVCLLGSAPPDGFIEYGISVFCDPTATAEQIGDAIEPLDAFNNSGTALDAPILEGLSADPRTAKSMAQHGDLSCVPTL